MTGKIKSLTWTVLLGAVSSVGWHVVGFAVNHWLAWAR